MIIDLEENEILNMAGLRIEVISFLKDKASIIVKISNTVLFIKKKTIKITSDRTNL